jgi:hypothetical protein
MKETRQQSIDRVKRELEALEAQRETERLAYPAYLAEAIWRAQKLDFPLIKFDEENSTLTYGAHAGGYGMVWILGMEYTTANQNELDSFMGAMDVRELERNEHSRKQRIREEALAKLTSEELEVLGLSGR